MRIRLAVLLLACAAGAWGAYTYDYIDPSGGPFHYTTNGDMHHASGYQASTGGSYILTASVSGNANDYEVWTPLSMDTGGGVYVHFLRASSSAYATASSCTGSYLSSELSIPTSYSGGIAAGTVSVNQCSSGTLSSLGSVSVGVPVGSILRSVIYGTTLLVYLNDRLVVSQTVPSTTGQPGVGGYRMSGASGFPYWQIGHHETTAPGTIGATDLRTSLLPGQVSLQWPGVADDSAGTGVYQYIVARNGTTIGNVYGAEFADSTVSASTSYTYTISAVDFHGNTGSAATFSVTTPASTAVDPRRSGVSTTGSYWGGGGEQIDMLSGNLNFSLPLLSAMGRTGWTVPVGLSYNSQIWRQDGGANWQLGADMGYGYGWKVQIGSLTPYYAGTGAGVDHYVFADGSGAEYQLNQHSGSVWSSKQGIYVWFDDSTSELHFKNGMFWYMGSVSEGSEADAGTLYPTVIEDTGGNEVIVTYAAAWSQPSGTVNTSGRIYTIEDTRGNGSLSYRFNWYLSHLYGVDNWVGTPESYTFSYTTGAAVMPPFGTDSSYTGRTTTQLAGMSVPVAGSYAFTYDTVGANELLKAQFPWGGYLRWDYGTATYAGSRLLREVDNRYMYSSATTGGTEYGPYPLTHSDTGVSGGIPTVHADTTLVDASGNGAKKWTFNNSSASAWQIGLVSQFDQKVSATGTAITTDTYSWSQTPTSANPYISQKVSVKDPGTGAATSAQTNQAADQYGNTTQIVIYPYNNTTTPLITYNSTFVTSSTYTAAYLRGLLSSATATVGGTTTTLVTNNYDSCINYGGPFPAYEYDAAGINFVKGYLYSSATPVGTTSACHHAYGTVSSTTAVDGTTTYATASSATDYALPDTITTPTYSNGLTYNSWLGVTATTGANGETMYMTYDSLGRPATATSPYGTYGTPTEAYAYSSAGTLPAWQTTTGANGFARTTLDGFGRPILTERGTSSSAIASKTDTVYAPCACSPLGKLQKASQPYAPGGTAYWTQYSYDGIGRTLTVQQPDGVSTTSYAYAGNQTTVTDPAGKWKTMTSDVSGNLTVVTEPDPANPLTVTLATYYSYDWMSHLVCVDMTRGGTAAALYTYTSGGVTCTTGYTGGTRQSRTFVYDGAGQLTSATNPESGTVTYTYNSDHTLQQKQDAKGQATVYTYDSAKRVTEVQIYPYGTGYPHTDDPCQQVTYGYDAGTNGLGRLTSAHYLSPLNCGYYGTGNYIGTDETYTYHAAGGVTQKTMTVNTGSGFGGVTYGAAISVIYGYDSAGRRSTTQVSTVGGGSTGYYDTFTNSYDSMGRLGSMTDSGGFAWAQNSQYDAAGRMTGVLLMKPASPWYGDSWQQKTMTYNVNGQLTDLYWGLYSFPNPSPNVRDLQYSYSATQNNGQITQMTDIKSGEVVAYAYDTLRRLTSASSTPTSGSSTPAWTQTYGYDGFGNMTSKVLNGGSNTAPAVNGATNQLSGASYDANGNMLTGTGSTFTYDGRNRMGSATPLSGGTAYYGYAADNKRVYVKDASGNETFTFYGTDGEKLCDFVPSGTSASALNRNVWFGGKLIAKVDLSIGRVMVQRDRLGTDRETGARYYPYGEEITSTANDTEKFGTYVRDGFTGLDYADQRYYASAYGRFNTADPYMASAGPRDPGSWNRYSYALGDPVNSNDPRGLCVEDGNYTYWDTAPPDGVGSGSWILEDFGSGACMGNPGFMAQMGTAGEAYIQDEELHTYSSIDVTDTVDDIDPIWIPPSFPDATAPTIGLSSGETSTSSGVSRTKLPPIARCRAAAIAGGLAHTFIDGLGVIPGEGVIAAGFYGGTTAFQAVQFGSGLASTAYGIGDTSTNGLLATSLGTTGIAIGLASKYPALLKGAAEAVPVAGQLVAGFSMLLDIYSAYQEYQECSKGGD